MAGIDTSKLTKLYYSIGEVADMFDVNSSLIRFWEKEFSIIKPKKNKKGNRLFTVKDITNFNKIYELVKVQGFTLEGAKKALKEKREVTLEEDSSSELVDRLEKIKTALLALKSN